MILTSTMPNIYDGYFGAERFGTGAFGVASSGIPAIINAMPADALSTLTQTERIPQEVSLAVIVDGVDVTSNTTYYRVNNLESLPGGALLRMAGIAAPAVGSTVAIDYMLLIDGSEYIGRIFSGIVGSVTTTQEPRGMPIHAVICRESATFYALQLPPVTAQYTGTAHDLARIELAQLGLACALDFDDFDIYAGTGTGSTYFASLFPSQSFSTVDLMLKWMAGQTGFGVVSVDGNGIVRVFAIGSSRAVDITYTDAGQTSSVRGSPIPTLTAPVSYGARAAYLYSLSDYVMWANVYARRPMPVIGEDDYAAKLADWYAVTAVLNAFAADIPSATYHDVTVSLNPTLLPGHKVTFADQAGATKTGMVTGVQHEGAWPDGHRTMMNIVVMP